MQCTKYEWRWGGSQRKTALRSWEKKKKKKVYGRVPLKHGTDRLSEISKTSWNQFSVARGNAARGSITREERRGIRQRGGPTDIAGGRRSRFTALKPGLCEGEAEESRGT